MELRARIWTFIRTYCVLSYNLSHEADYKPKQLQAMSRQQLSQCMIKLTFD